MAILALVLVLSLVLFVFKLNPNAPVKSGSSGANSLLEIKVGHANREGDPSYDAWVYFKQQIEERSKGEITVKLFPDGQAGDERELIEAVRNGRIDLATVNVAALARVHEQFNLFVLPYLWKDEKTMLKFCDSPAGQKLAKSFEKKQGIHLLSFWSNGTRHCFQSTKPIYRPEDFEGVTMRVMNNDVYIRLFSALGAKTVPLAFGEVQRALTNGVIDAADNDTSGYMSMKFYKPAKYFSLTGHVVANKPQLASLEFIKKLEALPKHHVDLFYDVVNEVEEFQRKKYESIAEDHIAWMKQNGIKVNEITGISVGNALGQSITSLMPEVKLELEHIRESIESKEIKKFSGIATLRRDSTVYEDITVYPLVTNGAGGAVIRIDDVTKEYLLQEQLNQNRKMEAIGQLAGSIAHDFNNMLSGIMGSAEVLQSSKHNLDDEGLEFVDMILEASRQAADLTAKLLAFGRKGAILDNALDIHALIDDTHAIFKRTIDKKIKTSIAKNAENSTVMGDNSSLQNVLLNLVINASHAMPDGGELKIETRNLNLDEYYCNTSPFDIKAGDYIEIEVRDNGCGIPQENLHKIFDPFFTTKEYGKGTGLGLASVYGTIQDHHGVVNVYSEVGTGTVFHLFLPCSEQTVKIPDRREVVLKGTGQGLLVDDEEIIRKTGKRLLEEMGYKINLAKNGTEAVAMFAANYSEIDFVIMDMIMPEMNGSEAFYKMKEIDNDCIVIISSGFLKDENLNELKDAGLAGFIQKPFRDYELSKLLSRVLGKEPV